MDIYSFINSNDMRGYLKKDDAFVSIISKVSYDPVFRTRNRIMLHDGVSLSAKQEYLKKVHRILSEKILTLLYSTAEKKDADAQNLFDMNHHKICEGLISMGTDVCTVPYGVVQKWLNETLMYLAMIDSEIPFNGLPIQRTRKCFHVPVEQFVMEMAARPENFYLLHKKDQTHALCLPCVPLKHNDPDDYHMNWYRHGYTQLNRLWEYPEYMEFQISIRNRIKELVLNQERNYKDTLDWVIHVYEECK